MDMAQQTKELRMTQYIIIITRIYTQKDKSIYTKFGIFFYKINNNNKIIMFQPEMQLMDLHA